jgi:hypothetical protein
MEQNPDISRPENDDVDVGDEITSHIAFEMLHLPSGLDLLFQLLDEMSDGTMPEPSQDPAQGITPTPYFRTPTLGS